ncbi:hypothetical protein [Bradyrhizobium sp. LHD-71]|uniref:hypothetical protein n=1 Tax=Bradyrhizobium sp. LHD-71 TaxID=3072141 RepID=UPI00281008D5|nr:hypothetical protein [Bradyrhizobium sp. LHD-71]MDQ8730607.1 hypothetical protein [Bradyrhizobium sp. LHD-71]
MLSADNTPAVPARSGGARKRPARANTSIEEQEIRAAVEAWGRKRFGDVRVIHEFALGERRIDMVLVGRDDIIGVEIKGPRDSLSDGRLTGQLREFNFYLPEVWLAVAPRWLRHADVRHQRNLLLPTVTGIEIVKDKRDGRFRPERDEFFCSRLIELLWVEEAARIAQRTDVIPGVTLTREPTWKVKRMLARMLSGHEIVKQVCIELRARPLVGLGSDRAMR